MVIISPQITGGMAGGQARPASQQIRPADSSTGIISEGLNSASLIDMDRLASAARIDISGVPEGLNSALFTGDPAGCGLSGMSFCCGLPAGTDLKASSIFIKSSFVLKGEAIITR